MPSLARSIAAVLTAVTVVCGFAGAADAGSVNSYAQKNLVSNRGSGAAHTDAHLINPWGIAFNPFAFVWISNNGTDTATLYDGGGVPSPLGDPLVVSISAKAPTGIVFNGSPTDFTLKQGGQPVPTPFVFVTESGSVVAWAPSINRTGMTTVFTSKVGAIYKGVAISGTGRGQLLHATDFHNGRIDVFDPEFRPVHLRGGFVDPRVPQHFAPFGIRSIDGALYVTYARHDADAEDDVSGPGLGFVDVFNPDGTLVRRLISRGVLNAPWGLAVSPVGFGPFGGRLLVGNFGDGRINAFDLATGSYVGTLDRPSGAPVHIDGLWGVSFGNGVAGQAIDTLYFTAGPNDEADGLYGQIRFGGPRGYTANDETAR